MANTDFRSVDEYLAQKPAATRRILARVRATIRRAVPNAEEVISYQIPAYKLEGVPVLFFAGWQEHFSLYPASAPLVAAFERELAEYEVSKGTIRFPLAAAIPSSLIARLAKFRAKEAAAHAKARTAARQAKAAERRANAGAAKRSPKAVKARKVANAREVAKPRVAKPRVVKSRKVAKPAKPTARRAKAR